MFVNVEMRDQRNSDELRHLLLYSRYQLSPWHYIAAPPSVSPYSSITRRGFGTQTRSPKYYQVWPTKPNPNKKRSWEDLVSRAWITAGHSWLSWTHMLVPLCTPALSLQSLPAQLSSYIAHFIYSCQDSQQGLSRVLCMNCDSHSQYSTQRTLPKPQSSGCAQWTPHFIRTSLLGCLMGEPRDI